MDKLSEGPIYMCLNDNKNNDIDVDTLSRFGCGCGSMPAYVRVPVDKLIKCIDKNNNDITEQFKEQYKGKMVWIVPKDKVGDVVCQEQLTE